jgi:hypothetical protein
VKKIGDMIDTRAGFTILLQLQTSQPLLVLSETLDLELAFFSGLVGDRGQKVKGDSQLLQQR